MRAGVTLRIMLFMAAILVAGQTLFLMLNVHSASFEGLGTLSAQTVSFILLQIVILACFVGYVAWRNALGKDMPPKGALNIMSASSFVIGLVLSIEGLVAIILSGSIISGTTPTIMISVGLLLYTLGILSMVAFVQNESIFRYPISTPFVGIMTYTLLMLPPALLVIFNGVSLN